MHTVWPRPSHVTTRKRNPKENHEEQGKKTNSYLFYRMRRRKRRRLSGRRGGYKGSVHPKNEKKKRKINFWKKSFGRIREVASCHGKKKQKQKTKNTAVATRSTRPSSSTLVSVFGSLWVAGSPEWWLAVERKLEIQVGTETTEKQTQQPSHTHTHTHAGRQARTHTHARLEKKNKKTYCFPSSPPLDGSASDRHC